MSVGHEYYKGTTTGTGSSITISLGFVPTKVVVRNRNTNTEVEWNSTMGTTYQGTKKGGTSTMTLSSAHLAVGSTPANVANGAFQFQIAGVEYAKAAVAAGTAPTSTTIPSTKYGLFGYEIGADGTIDKKDASGNATGYNTAALAIAALPTASSSHVLFGYVVVTSTATSGFIGATTSLSDAKVTATYYNIIGNLLTTGGITSYDGTDYKGFKIGTDAQLNASGDTLEYEAWR